MTDNEGRIHQTGVRMRGFFAPRTADFSETSVGHQLINDLGGTIEDLETYASDQAASSGRARQHTNTRGDARRALREDLEAINRTARLLDLEDMFRLPPVDNDEASVNAGHAFAVNALPVKAQFIAHELPADFLEDLSANTAAMEAAIAAQGDAVGDRVHARQSVGELIERLLEIRRKLNIIVQNKYGNDPATLAEWASASHIERAPRGAAAAGTTPPPPPPSPAGTTT
jgi:hypothetical protein